MAQPQYQYPPRAFSPPQRSASPHPGAYLPPSKRQRLSPNPQSPYSSPSISHSALPSQIFSSPYYSGQPNGVHPNPPQEPTNAPPSAGAMGPPSRPLDKPTDMNELSDVLAGSGVDLKEEEAALYHFNNVSHQQNGTVIAANPVPAFTSSGLNGTTMSMFPIQGTFNTLSQNMPGDRASFFGAGTFNQPAVQYQSIEERADEELARAQRRKAERRQYHLNDPFLYAATIQRSLSKQSHYLQVTIPKSGLFSSNYQSVQPTQLIVAGPDKNEVLTTVRGQDLIHSDAPLAEIITLLSLATQERLRAVVEDTATLAKARRAGSHGIVPLDFLGIAIGNGSGESANALPTQGDNAIPLGANPLKRSFSGENKLPTPISEGDKTPHNPIAFSNPLVQVLRHTTQSERTIEEERKAKRERRLANKFLTTNENRSGSMSAATPTPSTPGFLGERAPDVDSKKGITKKEQKRLADAKSNEVNQHMQTNKGIHMALGGFGKKLSWMTKDDQSGSSGFPVSSKVNATPRSQAKTSNGSGIGIGIGTTGNQALSRKRTYGDFREDKETGTGIQIRDLVHVLEPEPKERRTLARAYAKLGSKS